MRITKIQSELFDFSVVGIAFTLVDGRRIAVRIPLWGEDIPDLDTEELPELLAEMGKKLRKFGRQAPKDMG